MCFWWWHFWSLMPWTSCWGCAWMISNQWTSLWHSGLLLGSGSHVFFPVKIYGHCETGFISNSHVETWLFSTNQKKIWFHTTVCFFVLFCPKDHLLGTFFPSWSLAPTSPRKKPAGSSKGWGIQLFPWAEICWRCELHMSRICLHTLAPSQWDVVSPAVLLDL